MFVLALLFAQAIATASVGQAAARPAECGTLEGGKASNVWERAKSPELLRYCDLLASGAAKLAGASMTNEVLAIAADADRVLPGRAAPSVLRGRAFARLGRYPEALAALEAAKARDDRALDEPGALLTWARSLAESGRTAEALVAYRALLPRASSLVSSDRGRAYVEAGLVAMSTGPGGLDEAVAILRQASREARDIVQAVAVASLALALDRGGEKAEARATLADRGAAETRGALSDAQLRASFGSQVARELDAMKGLAMEGTDAPHAREAWQRYLEGAGGKGPWADHARLHLAGAGAGRGHAVPHEGHGTGR
jgi:tetratricopeptide (TPR) repeat protein